MLMGPEKIRSLLPHGPGMRLVDEIIRFDDESLIARTHRHLDSDNPLRRSCGMLPISAGIEFAGQVTALHGALIEATMRSTPRQGFLVMAREVSWQVERLDEIGPVLEIKVILVSRNVDNAMYHFELLTEAHKQLMTGRIAVFFPGESA